MDYMPKVLFSREESAEYLEMSLGSLDILIAKGEIAVVKRGRRVFVHREELERAARVSFGDIWHTRPAHWRPAEAPVRP